MWQEQVKWRAFFVQINISDEKFLRVIGVMFAVEGVRGGWRVEVKNRNSVPQSLEKGGTN